MLGPSSPDALARHLLRHLFDLRELQRNELSAAFLRSLPSSDSTAVRHNKTVRWVHRGVETLALGGGRKGQLQCEILQRCDLLGQQHASVWADLGLSRRAFYNERRAALSCLALALSTADPSATVKVAPQLDPFEVRLNSARLLQHGGYVDLAARESEALAASAPSAEQRVRACAVALESHFLAGDLEHARSKLLALEEDLDKLRTGPAQSVAALVAGSTACACARWNLGETTKAFERFRTAQRALELRPRLLEDRWVADAWVHALLQLADFHTIAGSASGALAAIGEASALLANRNDADPDVQARLSINHALVALTLDRPLVEAEASARSALSQAQRFGHITRAVEAATTLCLVQAVSGNHRAALNTGTPALLLADRMRPHQAGVFLRLILARIYAKRGNERTSRKLLDEASESIPGASAIGVFRETTAASIDLSKGAFRAGLQRSREATDAAQRSGFGRATGAALALQARALSGLGRSQAAATAADAAVAILEKGGARYALADAYDLSGRLSGNRLHAKLATELRAVLSAPA